MYRDSHLSRTSKHSGAIKSLQFNQFRTELLATAGARGELYITDLSNASNPYRLGTSGARSDDFDALDWNKKVPHILATGSSGGFVTVWDLKAKKESLTLQNLGRKAVSAVAWDPEEPTSLATAVPNDQDPLILVWDLRNSSAPKRTLRAHEQGVLSISWCPQDSDLLLSCGKDNRTICWNPRTEQVFGEFPIVTNWTFQTKWNPHNPNFLATASYDGKIVVHTIQNTNAEVGSNGAATGQSVDGEDFFAKAQSQPQGVTFSLPKAPKWLERPVGASFAFGGKIVRFAPSDTQIVKDPKSRRSTIKISRFSIDSAISAETENFEESLKTGDYAGICKSKISESSTEEDIADWKVIETLTASNPRKALIEYLGFRDSSGQNAEDEASNEASTPPKGASDAKDPSSFFDEAGEGDNFLSNLAATKGVKTNNPFQLYAEGDPDTDRNITKALLLGSFEKALDICLKEDRLSDAFMIAICGGQKCIDKVQAAYFQKNRSGPNYLRLLASVVGKNLWDVVHNADLKNWKEVMASLCTFADETEFADLCEALGDRLEESLDDGSASSDARKDASFCYLAGSKLDKVVEIWIQELQQSETKSMEHAEDESSFSVHARVLQSFIEKVTVFRQVTKFQDNAENQSSGGSLAPLYAKYTEYADVLAAHGQIDIAEKYLNLLPAQYADASMARDRIKQATKKAAPQPAPKQPSMAKTAARAQPVAAAYQPVQAPSTSAVPPPATNYAPTSAAAPVRQTPASYGYTPAGYQPPAPMYPQSSTGIPQPQAFGAGYQQPPQAVPPPPRAFNASPSMPPPSKAANMSNWNDAPDLGTKPLSRRGTPGMGPAAISSPFPNQPAYAPNQPFSGPSPGQRIASPPLPPPPKGPPRLASPPTQNPQMQPPERRPSAAANAYAPQQPINPVAATSAMPAIRRESSPYNPPPSGAPPSNRYAPAPSTQAIPQQAGGSLPPPPLGSVAPMAPPPPNPYAQPSSTFGAPPSTRPSYAASQGSSQPPLAPPPQGPPRGPPQGPPPGMAQGVLPGSRPSTSNSQRASAPPPAKHRKQ